MTAERRFRVTLVLFVVSGAAGLIDQICFSKYLGYIVGSTAYAVSAVLAAFMAGLALGAHFGGRFASRVKRPLLAYGILEVAVGATLLISVEGDVESLKAMVLESTDAADQAKAAVKQNSRLLQEKIAEKSKLLSQLEQAKMQEEMNKADHSSSVIRLLVP